MARPRSSFDTFCCDAFDLLERSGVRYLVIGGLAVVVVGEPRTTGDADVIGFVTETEAHHLIDEALRAGFQVDAETERRRLRETGTLRFRRSPFQLDVITASMPFEEDAFRRATLHRMFGRALRFPSPEDMILFKVLAGRDKDMLDAIGVAKRHVAVLDRSYLEATLRPICDLAEDLSAWHRLQDVFRRAAPV